MRSFRKCQKVISRNSVECIPESPALGAFGTFIIRLQLGKNPSYLPMPDVNVEECSFFFIF